MPPILTRKFWTYARFDKLLNRVILGCGGFLFILAIIVDDSSSSSRRFSPQSGLNTSDFIALLQSPCETIDERVAFFEACQPFDAEAGNMLAVCPADMPAGLKYRPTSMDMVKSTINALKSRKASPTCGYLQTVPVTIPDLNEIGWSESQKRLLEQIEETAKAVERVNEERKAMRDGTYEPPQFGPGLEEKTDDQN